MKISGMAWSWILRGIGMLSFLPVIFANQFVWLFPALDEPRFLRAFLWGGAFFFLAGAVLYHIARQMKKKEDASLENDAE